MDAITAIMTRRSIRSYTKGPVPDQALDTAIKAAQAAPSAGNCQPWHFIVVRERATLEAIPSIHRYAKMAPDAQVGILVCADPSQEKYPGFWVQDCSAATVNLLLALHAQGLGAVWTGIHPDAERVAAFQKMFEMPQGIVPFALVLVGQPVNQGKEADRYRPERVHKERW